MALERFIFDPLKTMAGIVHPNKRNAHGSLEHTAFPTGMRFVTCCTRERESPVRAPVLPILEVQTESEPLRPRILSLFAHT